MTMLEGRDPQCLESVLPEPEPIRGPAHQPIPSQARCSRFTQARSPRLTPAPELAPVSAPVPELAPVPASVPESSSQRASVPEFRPVSSPKYYFLGGWGSMAPAIEARAGAGSAAS